MKILINRIQQFQPFGQILYFEDGTDEFDPKCSQTTPIMTAQLYNGKAAKNEAGEWVAAPGPRNHEHDFEIMGFKVGLTSIGFDSDNKAIYDYSVCTPTGVWFHGDGKDNTLHTPSSWMEKRVAIEIIWWVCIGEDAGGEFPSDTTEEQWGWIRSNEREMVYVEIDEMMQAHDQGNALPVVARIENIITNNEIPQMTTEEWVNSISEEPQPTEDVATKIKYLTDLYMERYVYACQSGLVTHLLDSSVTDPYLSWDDVTSIYPNADAMDGEAAVAYIESELTDVDWHTLIDIAAYNDGFPVDDDFEVNPANLDLDDIGILQQYIADHAEPREIFEWWLVDKWLATQLNEIGESIVTDDSSYWWGRSCTGQAIIMDGTLQKVAAKFTDYL